jgi:hypothetical protein
VLFLVPVLLIILADIGNVVSNACALSLARALANERFLTNCWEKCIINDGIIPKDLRLTAVFMFVGYPFN